MGVLFPDLFFNLQVDCASPPDDHFKLHKSSCSYTDGGHKLTEWMPAFAGMTYPGRCHSRPGGKPSSKCQFMPLLKRAKRLPYLTQVIGSVRNDGDGTADFGITRPHWGTLHQINDAIVVGA